MTFSPQRKYSVTLLTPLFSGGAAGAISDSDRCQQLRREGLRAPAVKYAIRYWYRTVVAGSLPAPSDNDEDVSAYAKIIRDTECRLLGGTTATDGNGPGSRLERRGSTIQVRTKSDSNLEVDLYGVSMNRYGSHQRCAIVPGATFTVTLRALDTDKFPESAAVAWTLMTALGGIGARTTRGFGSLSPSCDRLATNGDRLPFLRDAYSEVISIAHTRAQAELKEHPDYDLYVGKRRERQSPIMKALSSDCLRGWLLEPKANDEWSNLKVAMDDIRSNIYNSYKENHGIKYTTHQGHKFKIGDSSYPSPLHLQLKRVSVAPGVSFTYGVVLAWSDKLHGEHEYFGEDWKLLTQFLEKLDNYRVKEIRLPDGPHP